MFIRKVSLIFAILSSLALLETKSILAQQIQVDGDTATIVTENGNKITINGGDLSGDGKNLFHSLKEFGLSNQQIAEFMTNSSIQNILTRVTGGNASYIDGRIQVTGGNSNLFLINPAGIIFGNNATLNVPADFTATTTTGIGFGDSFFNAIGSNDYQNLVGNPTSFVFNTNNPGSIINTGELKVGPGNNLTLVGGNVINTGTIESKQGKINIEAVEGTSRIKITPEGSLLSLEINPPVDERGNPIGFTPQDLPALLTGGNNAGVTTTGVAVNGDTGNAQVAGVDIPNETGVTVVSGELESSSNTTTGGDITVLGNKIVLLDADVNANGATGGGEVKIGGDFQGNGTIANASVTAVDGNSSIKANATNNGDGGEVIIWADGNTIFTGEIEAKGGVNGGNGGFVEVSGKQNLFFNGQVDTTAVNGTGGSLLLDPENVTIVNGSNAPEDNIFNGQILANEPPPEYTISEEKLEGLSGTTNVVIEANNNITIADLADNELTLQPNVTQGTSPRSSVTFTADADGDNFGDFSMNDADTIVARGRDVNISGENISVGAIDTAIAVDQGNGNGGDINLTAQNDVSITGVNSESSGVNFSLNTLGSRTGTGNAGNVNINAINGSITIAQDDASIISATNNGDAGSIFLSAPNGNINLPLTIRLESFSNDVDNGSVTLIGNNIQPEPQGSDSTINFTVDNQINLQVENLDVAIANPSRLPAEINISGDNVNVNQNINSNGANLNIFAQETITLNNTITSNAGDVLLNADADNNSSGTITMNSGSSITSNGGQITLNSGETITTGAIDSGNGDISISASSGNINIGDISIFGSGAGDLSLVGDSIIQQQGTSIQSTGNTILNATNDIILNQNGNNFQSVSIQNANNVTLADSNDVTITNVDNLGNPTTINISGDLQLDVIGNATIDQNLQGTNLVTASSGTITINASQINTSNDQTYNNPVMLKTDTSLSGNQINFNNTVDGENNLTVISNNGNVSFKDTVGGMVPLGELTVTANKIIFDSESVTTTGKQEFNGNEVEIGNNLILTTSDNDITFGQTVNSESGESNNLTLNSGSGNLTFNGALGDSQPLGDVTANSSGVTQFNSTVSASSLTTDAGGTTNINGDVTTTDNQTYNNDVVLNSSNNLITLEGNNITFGQTLSSEVDGEESLRVNASETNFNGAVGDNNQALASLETDADGTTNINGGIVTTTGDQTYNDRTNIQTSTTFTSKQGNLNLQGGVNANSNNVTVTTSTGVDFSTNDFSPSNGGNLLLQNINSNEEIIIGSGDNIDDFVIRNLDKAIGFDSIVIGENNSITVNEDLTINSPLTLQGSEIFINNDLEGKASITINGTGTTTTLNADIITQGEEITINDNIILGNDVSLRTNFSTTSANVNLNGNVNSSSSSPNSLTIDAGTSDFLVTGSIGNEQPLQDLSITANNITIGYTEIKGAFSAQDINTNGRDLTIIASEIKTGDIKTTPTTSSRSDSGDVTLRVNLQQPDPNNILEVSTIDTHNTTGIGGNIEISTLGKFRATDVIPQSQRSINGGGDILIDLFPDGSNQEVREDPRLPFVVGDPNSDSSTIDNGTLGLIGNNNSLINSGSYTTTQTVNNITINLLEPEDDLDMGTLPEDDFDTRTLLEIDKLFIPPADTVVLFTDTIALFTGLTSDLILSTNQAREILTAIEKNAGEKPAFIYVSFTPKGYQPSDLEADFARREITNTQEYSKVDINQDNLPPSLEVQPQDDDILDLLIITGKDQPIRITIPVTRKEVVENAANLWGSLADLFALDDRYKPYASNLYDWLIKPLEAQLEKQEISNLLFILPTEIRFTPLAALYDSTEDKFLVEKYSSALAPSLNLNDNRYRPLLELNLLAMGASNFAEPEVVPLPAAGLELPTIRKIWNDKIVQDPQSYINDNFTLDKIKSKLSEKSYGIIHFGTHGEFNPGKIDESYIQLYNSRLGINEISNFGLNDPLVELMVLSACETAFGNEIAELGFAGLAVKAGVKTAMGSVWQVSDTGTLALMTSFYSQLKIQSTKAEALRQAQLNLLQKKVYKSEDGSTIITPEMEVSLETLPENSRASEDFSHPFYWAPFTMIGNPW